MPRRSARTVGPVVMAAGLAASAWGAAGAGAPPRVSVSARADRGESVVALEGRPVRTTAARVGSARAHAFPGSPSVLVTWEETDQRGATSWMGLSRDGGRSVALVRPVGRTLRLKLGEFDPVERGGAGPVPAPLRAQAPAAGGGKARVVQLAATPIAEIQDQVRALGGVVEGYLPENALIVSMDEAQAAAVSALPYVRWVGAYEPAFKLEPGLARQVALGTLPPAARYSIEVHRRGMGQQQAVAARVTRLGGIVETTTPGQFRLEATLTQAQLADVLAMDEVAYVDAWGGPGGLDMAVIKQVVGATGAVSSAGFTGQGVRAEVHDSELRATHAALQNPAPLLHAGPWTGLAHGTSCYGIVFANWPGNPTYNGLLPDREQGIFISYLGSSQFAPGQPSRLQRNAEATDAAGPYRSVLQTSSVGSSELSSTYTTVSAEVDDYLFQVDYLSFQSQSNAGSTLSRPQAWAKNIVSVGGVYWLGTPTRADDAWNNGASFGPAADGRQKPDLTAFFDQVPTIASASDTAVTTFGGTSAATPITAGAAGLVAQMWHQGVWRGFGGASTVFDSRPVSSTTKALLINTAHRYPLTQGGLTRARQGWGMADLNAMFALRDKTLVINADQPVATGDTRTYPVAVPPGEPLLAVTMAYRDPKPATTAAPQGVNDLTLRLTAPDGVTVYWGNQGLDASNASTPGGGPQAVIDTVENVFIPNPAPGTWTVEVLGSAVVQDAYPPTPALDAAFSLVVTGRASACYANCDGSYTFPALNALDFSCFLARYQAGDPYANCDGSTTFPSLNALDFSCFLNRYRAGCP